MRIQHNIMAMNSYRNYTNNTSALSKNLEKLSSGYKINRAGDDAAGLAISEKMRAQITGLKTAQKNAKDGISLVQTAEGALTEVHDMLNRMVELADQSANGTYDNEVDRANLQKEFDALRTEIDRIADSSNFNGIKLLDGSLAKEVAAATPGVTGTDAPKSVVVSGDINGTRSNATSSSYTTGAMTGTLAAGDEVKVKVSYTDADGSAKTLEVGFTAEADAANKKNEDQIAAALADDKEFSKLFDISVDQTNHKVTITSKLEGKDAAAVTALTATNTTTAANTAVAKAAAATPSSWGFKMAAANKLTAGQTLIIDGVTVTEGTTSGLNAGDNAATQSAAIVAALNASNGGAGLTNWSVKMDGDTMVFTAKDSTATKSKPSWTGTGTAPADDSSKNVAYKSAVAGETMTAGSDPSMSLSFAGMAANTDLNGKVFTIGGKTYEILDDVSKVKEGNVAVQAGAGATKGTESLTNLVAALKKNGVSSASLNVSGTSIDISDLSEISVAQEGLTIDSTSDGMDIQNTIDVAGVYKVTAQAGVAGDHQATLEYLDNDGKKQSLTVDYKVEAGHLTANDVAKSIAKAINNDSKLSELFEAKADPATGDIKITSKQAGTDGARIIGIKNSEANQATNGMTGGVTTEKAASDAGKTLQITADIREGDTVTINGKTYEFVKRGANAKDGNVAILFDKGASTTAEPDADGIKQMSKDLAAALKSDGITFSLDENTGKISFKNADALPEQEKVGGGLTLQIGDTAEDFNQLTVAIDDMHAKALGLADISIDEQGSAKAAVDVIKKAINSVSSTRGGLGATQNRLEHTINNLSVMQENIQDAESNIRDVDVAEEMMDYTKNNILVQSAQAMLAQANQVPQGVLQLLQ